MRRSFPLLYKMEATMDKEQFGAFVAERRKEKNMTQKELADMLRISDKAVSKWERGLSFPDITMLRPLSQLLDVSLTELIEGRTMENEERLNRSEVDEMLKHTMDLNEKEAKRVSELHKKDRLFAIIAIIVASLAECSVLLFLENVDWFTVSMHLPTVLFITYFFGIYFWVVAKEKLPTRYDKEKVEIYKDGAFEMNMPGVVFNNNNWMHILSALRLWSMLVALIYPLLTILIDRFLNISGFMVFTLFVPTFGAIFSCFIPLHHTAKKYE